MIAKWTALVVGSAGVRQTNTSRHNGLHWVGIDHDNQSDTKQNPNLHSESRCPNKFLTRILQKGSKCHEKGKNAGKFVYIIAKKRRSSFNLTDYMTKNFKILISRGFENFTHSKPVGTPWYKESN